MKAILGIVVVIAVVIVLYLFAPQIFPWNRTQALNVPENHLAYRSAAYGFSFAYPEEYEALEYTEENVAIGRSTPQGFDALVEVRLMQSTDGVTYTNYEDFLYERARLACAADGPNESISCTTVQREEAFENESGLTGTLFYLEEVHTNLTDNSITTSVEGPFLAFNLSANAPEDQFMALIIHPPVTLSPETVNTDLIRSIANSVVADQVR